MSSVKMKHSQPRWCQFQRSNGNHFSSECNRNPSNVKNSRRAEIDKRKITSRSQNKSTIRRKQLLHAGKPEASKIFRNISTFFSSSEDEKEYTPELITLEEEEQKEIDAMAKDSEDENQDPAKMGKIMEKIMKTKNPDHYHHTILKTKFQKMINLQLMLKTKTSLKLLEHFQNTNG